MRSEIQVRVVCGKETSGSRIRICVCAGPTSVARIREQSPGHTHGATLRNKRARGNLESLRGAVRELWWGCQGRCEALGLPASMEVGKGMKKRSYQPLSHSLAKIAFLNCNHFAFPQKLSLAHPSEWQRWPPYKLATRPTPHGSMVALKGHQIHD